jgi:hypothetical protein
VDALRWLETIRAELVRQKLPPRYVARLVAELSDHLHSLTEDRMSTDAQDLHGMFETLGSPGQIAAAAKAEFRQTRFALRHPLVTFALGPIICVPLLVLLEGLGLWALQFCLEIVASLTSWTHGETPDWVISWQPIIAPLFVFGLILIPFAVAAWLFCRLGSRACIGWKWPLAACCLTACLAALPNVDVLLPGEQRGLLHDSRIRSNPSYEGKGMITLGFGLSRRPSVFQMIQIATPLAIGAWALRRQPRSFDRQATA